MLAADDIADLAKEYLVEEDGDRVELTQLLPVSSDVEPVELLNILGMARNALIKTKIKECFTQAQGLDQVMHALRHRDSGDGMVPPYDYGGFFDIAKAVINNHEDPL